MVFEITDGVLSAVSAGCREAPEDAERLRGPVIPGMPNLHSHAFQRAFAGLTERRGAGEDSFWTWRERMYRFVARIEPDEVQAIALELYVEMLKAGYTAVGEFHYLHHDPAGNAYADPAEMSNRVIAAAHEAGIAITHLPVLYAHGGFGAAAPGAAQLRFVHAPEEYLLLIEILHAHHRDAGGVRIGIAPHSLRAVTAEELRAALDAVSALDAAAPVHLHVAEQTKEVEECLAATGARPVAWLLAEFPVDERWCLVHATHIDAMETADLAASGAVAGLCPTTEANLGDGIFPAVEYLGAGGRFGIGSDSHVSVSPVEELRLLEYGQRLTRERRALLASPASPSVGRTLYEHAARGGAQALGQSCGSLNVGRRADLVVLDDAAVTLIGRHGDTLLDAYVFAGNVNPVRDVMVAGNWCVRDGHHPGEDAARAGFAAAMNRLLDA